MKRTYGLVLLLLSTFLLPAGAQAAPPDKHEAILTYSQSQMSLDEEKELIFEANAHRKAVWIWTAAENEYKAAIFAAILEQDRINDKKQAREEPSRENSRNGNPEDSSGRCGGDLPPCYVMTRESHGILNVYSGGCYFPIGYTGPGCTDGAASGKWQFLRSTWAKFMGYINAADAPEDVQDAKARLTWAGGDGCSHWSAC